jgi:hypothetical protein
VKPGHAIPGTVHLFDPNPGITAKLTVAAFALPMASTAFRLLGLRIHKLRKFAVLVLRGLLNA